ncbi:major facilitator superfamily domain-containing protein [Chaetomium strumarium]|uniref:Major facilitator superfamily domain-containing protein n=1 Tax=Chaetomium strumarium TaxID=1170767 RepID=A0AAJ0M5B2_9PEZI|nr:major facilitator superfamily domain-containing protein [Chaetomium strumarium]
MPLVSGDAKPKLEPDSNPVDDSDGTSRARLSDEDLESASEQRTPNANGAGQAPDGGAAAWLVVLGAWCALFCTAGWVNSIGVFQEHYQTEMFSDYDPSTIAWIPSLQVFFLYGAGPVVGALYDKFGQRWLVPLGSVLHILGLMMASLGTQYYHILLAQGFCSAIGASMIFQPALNCVHGWFSTKRSTAFGVVMTGASIGGIVLPVMLTRLIRDLGFSWSMRISAFSMLALLTIANLTLRSYTSPAARSNPLRSAYLKPFTETEFVLVAFGFLCLTYGIFVPIDYLPASAIHAGMARGLSQDLVPIFNAGSLAGRLAGGYIGDKVGCFNAFTGTCFLTGVWILALWIPAASDAAIVTFAILFGCFSGGYASLLSPVLAQISPMHEIGFRTGIVLFMASIGGLTTNPISGSILNGEDSGWLGVKLFAGVFAMLGTFMFCVAAAKVRRPG